MNETACAVLLVVYYILMCLVLVLITFKLKERPNFVRGLRLRSAALDILTHQHSKVRLVFRQFWFVLVLVRSGGNKVLLSSANGLWSLSSPLCCNTNCFNE